MSGEALAPEDAMRARMASFRDKVSRAYDDLADALQVPERPYVAFSGGKDSTVVLHMARNLRSDITALWFDDELEYGGTVAFVSSAAGDNMVMASGRVTHAQWFQPWTSEPFWRAPADNLMMMHNYRWDQVPFALGFDGAITGVRGQESQYRKMHVMRRGTGYERKDGGVVIQPIANWSTDDVWAYIAMNELPYHPVYDAMATAGIPRKNQRVGPLPLAPRWVLQAIDPTLPSRLEQRYGARW